MKGRQEMETKEKKELLSKEELNYILNMDISTDEIALINQVAMLGSHQIKSYCNVYTLGVLHGKRRQGLLGKILGK